MIDEPSPETVEMERELVRLTVAVRAKQAREWRGIVTWGVVGVGLLILAAGLDIVLIVLKATGWE